MLTNEIAAEVLGAKKYASVDITAVERICAEAAQKYTKRADAVKAAKKELHIIYGSFLKKDCHAQAGALIRDYRGGDLHGDREYSMKFMPLHASTSERAGHVREFYELAGEYIGADAAIADVGCGFNPFSIPFFPAKPKAYAAYDICMRTVALIGEYFRPLGETYGAFGLDAAANAPDGKFDAVLMLKLFPLLERQKKGRAFELLGHMDFRAALISFPTKSASGREKGMEAFYSGVFAEGLPGWLTIERKAEFANEIVFVVKSER